ncbi:MAG: hypothetical protein NTV01_07320 [Bacteroidia bacterium]|nr:hypothetical protein [Bacteroidia bacterium]
MKTMKTTIYHLILVPVILLFLTTCKESEVRDCENQPLVSITITGQWFCSEEPEIKKVVTDGTCRITIGKDIVFSGKFNPQGVYTTLPIPNSQCGLSNVKIVASAYGDVKVDSFAIFCCSKTLEYTFENKNCVVEPVTCNKIDTTLRLTIRSSGNCVLQNATFNDLKYNRIALNSPNGDRIKLDVTSLKNTGGRIFAKVPETNLSEDYQVIDNVKSFSICFDVDRSVIGTIDPVTFELPAECIDVNGAAIKSGMVTIIVNAEICDPVICNCPFDNAREQNYSVGKVVVNGQGTLTPTIFQLGNLGENCILQIDDIRRLPNGGDPTIAGEGEAWIIEMPAPQTRIRRNGSFAITAYFRPTSLNSLLYTERFAVYTTLYNDSSPQTLIDSCLYTFSRSGETCENVCPQITVLGEIAWLVVPNKPDEQITAGLPMDFRPGIITEQLKATMVIESWGKVKNRIISSFGITLPDGDYCSNVNVNVIEHKVVGKPDDSEFFIPKMSNNVLGTSNKQADLTITFETPSLERHLSSGHGDTYSCGFLITAVNGTGVEICRQEVELDFVVSSAGGIGDEDNDTERTQELVILAAFSQISDNSPTRSYHVYHIDEFDALLQNYGARKTLTPNFVTTTIPYMPKNVEFNIYVDVDSAENAAANFQQRPKLYLVNTTANNFSNITATPVASFTTQKDFDQAIKDMSLMQTIESSQYYQGSNAGMKWADVDRRGKDSFGAYMGLTVKPGEVYMVYDTTEPPTIISGYTVHRGVALIYISAVKSREENAEPTSGGIDKGSISFYVQYPVYVK